MDHDRLFKELLTTFFVEFIELFFPELASYVDRGSVEFLDKEVFTDVTHGERHEADIVAKARFRGKELGFLIHVEPQARRETVFARRMFTYFARFHEKYDLPVYPIAVFSYLAPRQPEPSEYRIDFPDLAVLTFNFRVVQLNRLAWRDFLDRTNPIAAALMSNMAMEPGEQARVKLACLRMLAGLQLDPARERLISGFIDQYLRLTIEQRQEFNAEMEQLIPQEKEGVMEIVTSWMEEGLEKGLCKAGRKAGRKAGKKESVYCSCANCGGGYALLTRPQRHKSRSSGWIVLRSLVKHCSISPVPPILTVGCNRMPRDSSAASSNQWSGSVSGSASATLSYGYSTNSTYSSSTDDWTSNGSASASGSMSASFSATSPFTNYTGDSDNGASISGTASGSGSDWGSYSYTETRNLSDNVWSSASGTGWASGGTNASWGYSAGGTYRQTADGGTVNGLASASGNETYTVGYNTSASMLPGEGWTQTGSGGGSSAGDASATFTYNYSYSGSGSGTATSGDGAGTTWNISDEHGSSGGSGTLDEPLTFNGAFAGTPTYTADTSQEDYYTTTQTGTRSGSGTNDAITNTHFSAWESNPAPTYSGGGSMEIAGTGYSWTPNTDNSKVDQYENGSFETTFDSIPGIWGTALGPEPYVGATGVPTTGGIDLPGGDNVGHGNPAGTIPAPVPSVPIAPVLSDSAMEPGGAAMTDVPTQPGGLLFAMVETPAIPGPGAVPGTAVPGLLGTGASRLLAQLGAHSGRGGCGLRHGLRGRCRVWRHRYGLQRPNDAAARTVCQGRPAGNVGAGLGDNPRHGGDFRACECCRCDSCQRQFQSRQLRLEWCVCRTGQSACAGRIQWPGPDGQSGYECGWAECLPCHGAGLSQQIFAANRTAYSATVDAAAKPSRSTQGHAARHSRRLWQHLECARLG